MQNVRHLVYTPRVSNETDFAALLAEHDAKQKMVKRPRVGDLVSGRVIAIGKDAVFLDVGGKAEGMVERNQLTDVDGQLKIAMGDVVEARVASDAGGVLTLRVKVARGPEAKAELVQAAELGIPVDGLVKEAIKGGVVVDVAGVRGFCPASQLDARFVEDVATFVGQRLSFRITRYEPGPRGNLVLSRRVLVEEEKAKLREVAMTQLVPGAVVRGRVVGMKPFGAFVDIGGMEGMLHISELGHARAEKIEDHLHIGDELDVQILKMELDEKGRDRISLSLKSMVADPWIEKVQSIAVGSKWSGKITRLAQFGAFVEIAPGIEGLVHISELGAAKRVEHPKEVVNEGQAVEVIVLGVDIEKRKLSLSMGAAQAAEERSYVDAARADAKAAAPVSLGTFGDLLSRVK